MSFYPSSPLDCLSYTDVYTNTHCIHIHVHVPQFMQELRIKAADGDETDFLAKLKDEVKDS